MAPEVARPFSAGSDQDFTVPSAILNGGIRGFRAAHDRTLSSNAVVGGCLAAAGPSAAPTLVRTQHLPPRKTPGQDRWPSSGTPQGNLGP